MTNLATAMVRIIWLALLLAVALLLPSIASAQTVQQKQYAEYQKQVELEKKRRDDYLKRQQQNHEETQRLTEQQRMRQRQNPQGGQSNIQTSAESSPTHQDSVTDDRVPRWSTGSSGPPKAINAAQEEDAEIMVKYIVGWRNHFAAYSTRSVEAEANLINEGLWREAVVVDAVVSGCEVIEDELKLLVVAERLAARIKSQPERHEAAEYLHRIYDEFPKNIIESAQGYWHGALSELQRDVPDWAKEIESNLLGVLHRLEREYIVPRASYWLEQTRK